MSNTMTAGKTAQAVIINSNDADRVTIEIAGSAFDNLKEITQIHNLWNGEDLTPAEVVERYLINDAFGQLHSKKADNEYAPTLCGIILEYFANVTNATAEEGIQLEGMFKAHGFDVQ